jgi:hypothetical protein
MFSSNGIIRHDVEWYRAFRWRGNVGAVVPWFTSCLSRSISDPVCTIQFFRLDSDEEKNSQNIFCGVLRLSDSSRSKVLQATQSYASPQFRNLHLAPVQVV